MKHPPLLSISVLLLVWLSSTGLAAEVPIQAFGDARFGFFASERDARDRSVTSEEDLKLRLRAGTATALAGAWQLRARFAGRFTTDQDRTRFWFKLRAPTRTGLADGDMTLDELLVQIAPPSAAWSLRAGRFQSKFELMGIASKSFDRNDSANIDITWTDGLHWQYAATPGWRTHLVLQGNAAGGTGPVARAPLEFDDGSSRVSGFAALESTLPLGPLVQRVFAVTWMPAALAADGIAAARRDDYFALTAKLFAAWPVGTSGMRGGLGGEAGFAPNTPAAAVVNPGAQGNADGMARQFSMNLWDFSPGHHIAFVYGRAGAGWLISPDFRNNDRLLEIRYQWRISDTWSLESRLRRREEIEFPPGIARPRIDDDCYFRFTWRFQATASRR